MEMEAGKIGDFCQVFEGHVLIEVILDVVHDSVGATNVVFFHRVSQLIQGIFNSSLVAPHRQKAGESQSARAFRHLQTYMANMRHNCHFHYLIQEKE